MLNTAEIRMENRNRLRRHIWQGGEHTKQSLAARTGLSIATCSTLLNEMEAEGEIIGEKHRLGEVGRSTVLYRANEDLGQILCLHCDLINGQPMQSWAVLSITGRILHKNLMQPQESITAQSLCQQAQTILRQHPAVSRIMLGVPGVVEGDCVRRCDLPQLVNAPLKTLLEQSCARPVHMENDMHFRIYGYARQHAESGDVITLCYWNRGTLPGTATCHKGMILTGQHHFAGCAVLLPGMDFPKILSDPLSPVIAETVLFMISLLNPGVMVLCGDLFTPASVPYLEKFCSKHIPKAYLPRFAYAESTEEEYLCGMYQRALDLNCTRKQGGNPV